MTASHYLYTYGYTEDEGELAELEIRAFFGATVKGKVILSDISIDPSRSVFIREKLHILTQATNVADLIEKAREYGCASESYKVIFLKHELSNMTGEWKVEQRLQLARTIGNQMPGILDLKTPSRIYAITNLNGVWYLGNYEKSKPIWMKHVKKPQGYSTALNARTARTLVNIANPHEEALTMIDPCCGIGTVLVEAASMGMLVKGRDKNPLACSGARDNLQYYNYPIPIDIEIKVIEDEQGQYDVAFLDLPYNLYTHSTEVQQHALITHAARIADRVVIVTIDSMDEAIQHAGLQIVDRATTTKQRFTREILICQKPDLSN
ncbi:RNA methyltransferase [Chryseomicrobium sp. FSL W7-1435]|uniref:TRM11 family SAM-dependent methyltransferase n=1 Tax=Chryseomicrobium sp. FSL W7-1435 TaxID=2921704 RepID=UPI003159E56B